MKKLQVGVIVSLNDDSSIPVFEEVSDEVYQQAIEYQQKEIYNIMKDYVFDKLKEKEEEEVERIFLGN